MTAPTSDERREAAARLRETRGIMAFVDALGIDPDSDWCWADVSRRVAYLIDPTTCQMVVECIIDHGSRSWGMRCTACGEEFERMKPSFGWSFCPHCGARVVERGER